MDRTKALHLKLSIVNDNNIAVLVPFCLIGLWFGIWGIWKLVRTRQKSTLLERSLRWDEVQGIVKSTAVVWAHVEIIYAYETPEGQFEGNEEISLPMVPFRGLAAAQKLNDAAKSVMTDFPPGQAVVVRYNPQKSSESVFLAKAT